MTDFSGLMLAIAMQTAPVIPPPPPVDKLSCILATVAVGDQPGAPLTMFNFFESGTVRIERELSADQAERKVEDLILQLDSAWYAQGRASVMMGGIPKLQINIDPDFAKALPNARALTLWDGTSRREQYDLKNFDRGSMQSWQSCVASVPPPSMATPTVGARYRAQSVRQQVTPLNRQSWITADDYPSRSLALEVTGTVAYTLDIDVNGRVRGCRTDNAHLVDADGIPNPMIDLNQATCRLIVRRARFSPATDDSGRPFAAQFTGRVRWALP